MKMLSWKNVRVMLAAFTVAAVMASATPMASDMATTAARNLSGAIPIQTISHQDAAKMDKSKFLEFHDYLEKTYPLIHKNLTREKVNELSLLYTWEGSDPAARPIIFLAHQDVVPIAPGTTQDWTHPPFSGEIADGYIWGRGTMDDKGSLIGVMDAAEGLLAEGYAPRRTVYLAFGHDEEVGGWNGAEMLSQLLESRGVRAEYVVDEGGFIVDGEPLGIDKPVSLVGIAEKGYMSLQLKVEAPGGHSSMPPPESAIGILGAAIHRLETHQFPARLEGVSIETFKALSSEMSGSMRFAINMRWLIGGLIKKQLSKMEATNALIRTTTATTIINAGTKENVLPQEAVAVVNFRLLPGDSVDYVIGRVNKVIDDPRVSVVPIGRPLDASNVSSTESEGFAILSKTIAQVFPETLIAPYLVLGGTDSRHYENICDSVYRYVPFRATKDDQGRAHGTDERMAVANLGEIVRFYRQMILNSE